MRTMFVLVMVLLFTPVLGLAIGGYTVWKENRAARRKRSA